LPQQALADTYTALGAVLDRQGAVTAESEQLVLKAQRVEPEQLNGFQVLSPPLS
jgi:hypothetical protein